MTAFPLYGGTLGVERDIFTGAECVYEYGADSSYPVYVQAGKRFFVDSRLRERLPESFRSSHDLIYLSQFDGVFSDYRLVKYSALSVAALDTLCLEGEVLLDAGSADGVLSILAARKNATHSHAIDTDRRLGDVMHRHMQENGIRGDAITFHALNLNNVHEVLDAIPMADITVVAANLGPHYGRAHFSAIDLLRWMPNVHTFVGGGYTLTGRFGAEQALAALRRRGFTEEYTPIIAQKEALENAPRMAFTIKRK